MKHQINTIGKAALVMVVAATLTGLTPERAHADNREHANRESSGIAPANSRAYGKTLAEWLATYWRWYYTGADPAQSTVGNVQLIPLPNGELVSGSWTPSDPALLRGSLEINVPPGTPFVLPLFSWVLEKYNTGAPDDVPINNAVVLAGAHPTLTIDGKTVISERNKAAYYVPPTAFDPMIVYPEPSSYGSIAAFAFQGVGVVGHPLSEGVHVIHLYEPLIIPAGAFVGLPDGLGIIYDNTWTITVSKPASVVPPNGRFLGRSYSQWSASWWQWAMELPVVSPAPPHPFIDDPDFDVTEGQHGNVWFLAAPFGTVQRSCTIPEGKALFVALINVEASSLEDPPFYGATAAEQRAAAMAFGDSMTDVFCTIDGRPVARINNYRVQSPQFSFDAPTPWIFGNTGGAGTSVGDGYYVLVRPLTKGTHTLQFGGAYNFDPANSFIDMTYHITVTDD